MRRIVYVFSFIVFALPAWAQSPFVPLNADYYHLIDRIEIRRNRWAEGFHSTIKPYNRQSIIQLTDSLAQSTTRPLSDTDYFNYNYLRDDSWEWVPSPADTLALDPFTKHLLPPASPGDSRRPFLKYFYRKKADFYNFQNADVDLHVNPVFYFGVGNEQVTGLSDTEPKRDGQPFVNTRGIEVRGSISRRLGFYTFFADNQAIFPRYVEDYARLYRRPDQGVGFAPGEGLAKLYRTTGADFLTARGYITFNALKVINLQFGHDRNFIGNGFRSMLLSDNSAPYLFLKFSTRIGRNIQYTNLFTQLQNTERPVAADSLIPQKFAAMHHLSINITPNINVGVFEAEVFSRDRLDLSYLNPIILYRYVESYRGSADNALIGIDFKANFLSHFQFYSQFILDEFLIDSLRKGQGSVTNKFALQAGLKYIDALTIPNLDLQAELNLARPYTYSHKTGQTSYTHYNQPLAHPLGANFIEGIGIVRYQNKKLLLNGTFGIMKFGTDPPNRNYGGNIMKDYRQAFRQEGNFIGQGRTTMVTYADARVSYMFRHNVFVEGRYLYRFQDSQFNQNDYVNRVASLALRWNFGYRSLVF
ncbi:hypothetical protein BN8_05414 [Fibrisoma limi BUZ 3]|uniref:Capsule assembly Wzi family protein n=1 Tax=Fibrisoma limi BUZ 3 TaxID=1185876 RepID=I2GQC4_9BACT|nr:hypothetical protein [Fibrisoma limi]CCH56102.1 hypothetical protein BN8_05414 [Fibrisoma limi BUZ 3]